MRSKCVAIIMTVLLSSLILSACSTTTSESNNSQSNNSQPAVSQQTTTTDAASLPADSQTASESSSAIASPTVPDATSTPAVTSRAVDDFGQLQVTGTNLCSSQGKPVQLKGMSLHGLQAVGDFISEASIKTLAEDWGCTVIRLPLYTESDCYIKYPDKYYEVLCKGIDLCIAQGIYVIVDWHILSDGNPNTYLNESIDLFTKISKKYGSSPNVIYEICNEPNSGKTGDAAKTVTWTKDVKPYAEKVIAAIRKNDPDNIIIIGSPNWSQDVDVAAADPVKGTNLMYSLHFYAGSHGQELRDKMDAAIKLGAAIFVTEWGDTDNTGNGQLYLDESDVWLNYLDKDKISWCNWSIGSSIAEKSNALKMNSSILTPKEKAQAHWPDSFLTTSGKYVRCKLLGIPYTES
jgi:endoglucanase